MEIVIASGNQGKIAELNALLQPLSMTCKPQGDFDITPPPETGQTFIENALIKARYAAEQTSLPAIADDSGIIVPALNGEPGVYSARYAGDKATDSDNNTKLLKALANKSGHERCAYFYCVMVFMRHATDPTPLIGQGQWQGEIINTPRGEQGFGYDPIFHVAELNKTAAECEPALKNKISHRAQATQQLLTQLESA
jgi:XTP/dITP diphosphohydrolase